MHTAMESYSNRDEVISLIHIRNFVIAATGSLGGYEEIEIEL
jgi:hypothetical protein